jgi:hypothetical protein
MPFLPLLQRGFEPARPFATQLMAQAICAGKARFRAAVRGGKDAPLPSLVGAGARRTLGLIG